MHVPPTSATRFPAFASTLRSVALGGLIAALVPLATAVTITVNAGTKIRTVDERVFGVNTAAWDSYCNTPETIALVNAAGIRCLRGMGGSLSDEYHWQTNTTLANTWQWATNFDAFANLAVQTSAQVVLTANYGTGTPEEAAAWVTYSNVTKRYGFKYWEVGNENYGTWETDTQAVPHDPFTYANRTKQYIAQMKAADPTIKVGVVIVAGEDENANNTSHPATNPRTNQVHNGWTPVMLATLRAIGTTPDFVAYHRYDGAPGQENDAVLLQKAKTWPTDITNIRQQLTDYLGAAGAGVEILVTENNSVYGDPGKQITSLVNALYMADSIGNVLQTECNALLWWDLRNGQNNTKNLSASLYGWRQYGDYGILTTPSTFGSTTANEGYPTYYAMKLFTRFARGGDSIVSVTTDSTLLSAFGCLRVDGTLRLLVINKSPTTIQSSTISLAGFTPAAAATTYTYGIPEDEAARTNTGSKDILTGAIANASTSFTTTFEPYSLTVISFTAGTSTPTPPPVVPPVTPPSSSSGGGGAMTLWFVAALAGLGLGRQCIRRN